MDLSTCAAYQSAKKNLKIFMERLSEAGVAVLLIMIPIVISSVPHGIKGTFQKYANGPDITMLCAVLYLDAWWKVRSRDKLDPSAKAMLEIFCVFGAMFTSAFASFLYADDLGLLTISLANNQFTEKARPIVFFAALFFSVWVRVRTNAPTTENDDTNTRDVPV